MKIAKTKAQKQALSSKSPQTQREKHMQDSLAEEGPARQAPRERGGSGAGTVRRKVRNQGGSSQRGRQGFASMCELSDRRAAVSQRTGNPTSGSRRSPPKRLRAAVCSEAPRHLRETCRPVRVVRTPGHCLRLSRRRADAASGSNSSPPASLSPRHVLQEFGSPSAKSSADTGKLVHPIVVAWGLRTT